MQARKTHEADVAASSPTRTGPERTIGCRRLFEGRALTLDLLEIEQPDGRRSTREVVRHPGAVAILARLPDGRFLFVRQYRKAVERAMVEAVAGTLEPGEAPDVCAHRELREESGYAARRMLPLGAVHPCPGYSEERLFLFYADLEPEAGIPCPDPDENLESLALAPQTVEEWIRAGRIEDAKTLACWLLWRLRIAPASSCDKNTRY